jgi:hypothetical protein
MAAGLRSVVVGKRSGGHLSPGLPTTTNESSFLPKSYESIRAADLQDRAFPQTGHVTSAAATIEFARAAREPGLAGQPGLVFLLPVYMYLFVVALGTDYNILMIARLREQAKEGMEPRQAVAVALQRLVARPRGPAPGAGPARAQ